MLSNIKYIRHQFKFVVFSDSLIHREVATDIFGAGKLIHGAGFLDILFDYEEYGFFCNCVGKSESLNVHPRHDDKNLIGKEIGLNLVNEQGSGKYIIRRNQILIFSNSIDHRHVASSIWSDDEKDGFKQLSAGNFIATPNQKGTIDIQCLEGSGELNRPVNKTDAEDLALFLMIQPFVSKNS